MGDRLGIPGVVDISFLKDKGYGSENAFETEGDHLEKYQISEKRLFLSIPPFHNPIAPANFQNLPFLIPSQTSETKARVVHFTVVSFFLCVRNIKRGGGILCISVLKLFLRENR